MKKVTTWCYQLGCVPAQSDTIIISDDNARLCRDKRSKETPRYLFIHKYSGEIKEEWCNIEIWKKGFRIVISCGNQVCTKADMSGELEGLLYITN